MPTCRAIALAVRSFSPVIITTSSPIAFKVAITALESGFTVSATGRLAAGIATGPAGNLGATSARSVSVLLQITSTRRNHLPICCPMTSALTFGLATERHSRPCSRRSQLRMIA
jgi:hypothetical protein